MKISSLLRSIYRMASHRHQSSRLHPSSSPRTARPWRATAKSLITATAVTILLTSCHDKGSDEPHPATLYDICEIASVGQQQTVLHLYLPDSDAPVILTSRGANPLNQTQTPPVPGTSILAAYTPAGGKAYTTDDVTIDSWATITNLPLQTVKTPEDLDGWDTDQVYLQSAWRAGRKICMRLRLPYSAQPRRFALLLDPATADDAIPAAYLYHSRPEPSATFNRQYYAAFDIAALWDKPSVKGLRIHISNTADPAIHTLLFQK